MRPRNFPRSQGTRKTAFRLQELASRREGAMPRLRLLIPLLLAPLSLAAPHTAFSAPGAAFLRTGPRLTSGAGGVCSPALRPASGQRNVVGVELAPRACLAPGRGAGRSSGALGIRAAASWGFGDEGFGDDDPPIVPAYSGRCIRTPFQANSSSIQETANIRCGFWSDLVGFSGKRPPLVSIKHRRLLPRIPTGVPRS